MAYAADSPGHGRPLAAARGWLAQSPMVGAGLVAPGAAPSSQSAGRTAVLRAGAGRGGGSDLTSVIVCSRMFAKASGPTTHRPAKVAPFATASEVAVTSPCTLALLHSWRQSRAT